MKLTSLRQRVEALPPEQRELAMSLYTEVEWRNRWDLNAWPHQLPPQDDEWRIWTIIGPPATGKTTAGMMWVKSLLDSLHDIRPWREIFALLPTQAEQARISKLFVEEYDRDGRLNDLAKIENLGVMIRITHQNSNRIHFGSHHDFNSLRGWGTPGAYIWADEAYDARDLHDFMPFAHKYVFTGPVVLHSDTDRLSRVQDETWII